MNLIKNGLAHGKKQENYALQFIVRSIRNQPDGIWNSVELLKIFINKGSTETKSSRLMNLLSKALLDEICSK